MPHANATRFLRHLAFAALACLAGAAHAVAQAPASAPPQPDRSLGLVSPVAGYALMALAAMALIAVSLLPAKRGHQD